MMTATTINSSTSALRSVPTERSIEEATNSPVSGLRLSPSTPRVEAPATGWRWTRPDTCTRVESSSSPATRSICARGVLLSRQELKLSGAAAGAIPDHE